VRALSGISVPNATDYSSPYISANGLSLTYVAIISGVAELYSATRSSLSVDFSSPEPLAVAGADSKFWPYYDDDGDLYFSTDHTDYDNYWARRLPGGGGSALPRV
jgi:hypothetical protein